MTEYNDLPAANMLRAEVENCDKALAMIDDGTGTLRAFTIGQKPSLPPDPEGPAIPPGPVQVVLADDAQQTTVDQIRAQIVTYQNQLIAELTAMGVTNPPARSA